MEPWNTVFQNERHIRRTVLGPQAAFIYGDDTLSSPVIYVKTMYLYSE